MANWDSGAAGVIFDLDGTLADTLEDITTSVNHALAAFGLPAHASERVRPMIGEGIRELLRRAAGSDDAELIEALVPIYRAHYRAHALDRTRLFEGMDSVLDALVARGCPLAVLSNKPHDFTEAICRVLLAPWAFRAVAGHREGDARKPDPGGAIALAARLERPCGEVYFVGDSAVDVRTAQAAGMQPVGVAWGFRELSEIVAVGASLIAQQPRELTSIILGRRGA